MSDEEVRPVPGDSTADHVMSVLRVDSEWVLTRPGDYETMAVEAMRTDGSGWRELVAITWPGRFNKTKEVTTVRMMMSAADARNLANDILHTCDWLDAAAKKKARDERLS